jgi:selenophosphate synthetase-related protein
MKNFTSYLSKILGQEPNEEQIKIFSCFDPYTLNINKRFALYSQSRPLFLNIDDEHYLYVSNHTNTLRCQLDMATRQLDVSECYPHENGTIMLGITTPEKEKTLSSRQIKYHIYIHTASSLAASQSLAQISQYADHISLIREESPWERLCRICAETNTGAHITASSNRLFKTIENGILYIVPDHLLSNFKNASRDLDTLPVFIGKTVSYPIVSLDNELGLNEIPILTLKSLISGQIKEQVSNPKTNPHEDNSLNEFTYSGDAKEQIPALFKFIENESNAYPEKTFKFQGSLPALQIDAKPLNGLSFSVNGIQLHVLSNIVNLRLRGLEPLALSYYLETSAESPQEIDPLISAISKSAKLFNIPLANNCIVPGNNNLVSLFFISKPTTHSVSSKFKDSNDFICLLGDPNGEIKGSAFAHILGAKESFTPPGVMSGTLVALVDVINECLEKKIIKSVSMIGRGGLIAAIHEAMASGKGANIYSERKGPTERFIFAEPQAAALVTIQEKHLIDLARITSDYNLSSTTIGRVSNKPEININNEILFSEEL